MLKPRDCLCTVAPKVKQPFVGLRAPRPAWGEHFMEVVLWRIRRHNNGELASWGPCVQLPTKVPLCGNHIISQSHSTPGMGWYMAAVKTVSLVLPFVKGTLFSGPVDYLCVSRTILPVLSLWSTYSAVLAWPSLTLPNQLWCHSAGVWSQLKVMSQYWGVFSADCDVTVPGCGLSSLWCHSIGVCSQLTVMSQCRGLVWAHCDVTVPACNLGSHLEWQLETQICFSVLQAQVPQWVTHLAWQALHGGFTVASCCIRFGTPGARYIRQQKAHNKSGGTLNYAFIYCVNALKANAYFAHIQR